MATHQPQCCHGPILGYFGKPTKSRSQEPSMYEILTWNTGNQLFPSNDNIQTCENCQKCSHLNTDHVEESGEVYRPKNFVRKEAYKQVEQEVPQNRRQSQRIENGNSSLSKKNVNYQVSQKQLAQDKSHFAQRTSISNKKQRPQSANNHSQKDVSRNNKTNSPPNYMKNTRKNVNETNEEKENRLADNKQKKIQKFIQTTRWIPNSAFTTYFGKPAFENYGRANTNPTSGGLLYGNYLKSHNVQPHRGQNSPNHVQSYSVALMKAKQIGQIYPYPPKMNKKDMEVAEKQIEQQEPIERNPICAEKYQQKSLPIRAPILTQLQKFGGKGIQKMSRTRFSASNSPQNYCEW